MVTAHHQAKYFILFLKNCEAQCESFVENVWGPGVDPTAEGKSIKYDAVGNILLQIEGNKEKVNPVIF